MITKMLISLKLRKEVLDIKLICCAKGSQNNFDSRLTTSCLNWWLKMRTFDFRNKFFDGKQWTLFV